MFLLVHSLARFVQVTKENANSTAFDEDCFVKFYMNQCPACRTYNVTYYQMDDEHTYYDVNCDDTPEVCQRFQVKQVPDTIFVHEGKVMTRLQHIPSKDQLRTFISQCTTPLFKQSYDNMEDVQEAMKGENYYFVLKGKEPLEAPFIPFRTQIAAAFLRDDSATEPQFFCVRKPDLRIQYQKELSNAFALRRFIENQNRDWLIKITGHSIQNLYRSRNELSFVVTREARDR